jgi:hypothetical protein
MEGKGIKYSGEEGRERRKGRRREVSRFLTG